MPCIKAIIFDFIGTLANVKNYSLETSKIKLHQAIEKAGFNIGLEKFLDAYSEAHEKYRVVRYQELVEVTNAIWISEALNTLGFQTTPEDSRIRMAVNVFFEDYLSSLELRPYAKGVLEKASQYCRLGLISNFTYAPVIYAGLRKLCINQFFNAILVSEDVGWRKPNMRIFEEALRRLNATAQETVYIGDSPLEDIKGAQAVGMKTIFVLSQFYSLENLFESQQKPNMIVKNVCELSTKLSELLEDMEKPLQ